MKNWLIFKLNSDVTAKMIMDEPLLSKVRQHMISPSHLYLNVESISKQDLSVISLKYSDFIVPVLVKDRLPIAGEDYKTECPDHLSNLLPKKEE
jgi:hypothetical protein